MHSVELLPDGETERAVREVWQRLADRRLASQADHRHVTNRPHLTLGTVGRLPPGTRARLHRVLAGALPLPLCLDGLVRFSGRVRVLAWAVRPDDALLALHERVWRVLRDVPDGRRPNPYLDPSRWVPHITLGRARDAVWAVSDEEVLSPVAGTPPGALRGEWACARYYDSSTRTVGGPGP